MCVCVLDFVCCMLLYHTVDVEKLCLCWSLSCRGFVGCMLAVVSVTNFNGISVINLYFRILLLVCCAVELVLGQLMHGAVSFSYCVACAGTFGAWMM